MTEENSSSLRVEVRDGRTSVKWDSDIVPLSKSNVTMYDRCPYKFYLQVICGKRYTAPEMEQGKRIHAHISEVYEKLDYDEIMKGNVKEQLMSCINPGDEVEAERLMTFVEMQVKKFEVLKNKELFFPIAVEQFLYDKKLQYYGTFDQLDGQDDNSYIVIDWKSGKYSKWYDSNLRFGMMGYIHLVKQCMRINVKEFVVFYLKDGHFFGPSVPHPATERAFYSRIKRTRERIKFDLAMNEFKKKTNACDWCSFYGKDCFPPMDDIGQVTDKKKERNAKGRMK